MAIVPWKGEDKQVPSVYECFPSFVITTVTELEKNKTKDRVQGQSALFPVVHHFTGALRANTTDTEAISKTVN